MTTPRDFDFEIKNLEEVLAAAQRRADSAKADLHQAEVNLTKLRAEKQKAFEKAHSGTRAEPVSSGEYLIARGHYLDSKYFAFYVDGYATWTCKPWCATTYRDQASAESEIRSILEGDREKRVNRKNKQEAS